MRLQCLSCGRVLNGPCLRCLVTRRDPQGAVARALSLYLEEYGSDGYNADTFVDFVASVVRPGGADTLIKFYEHRAVMLRIQCPMKPPEPKRRRRKG